jgi:hypothetical protein
MIANMNSFQLSMKAKIPVAKRGGSLLQLGRDRLEEALEDPDHDRQDEREIDENEPGIRVDQTHAGEDHEERNDDHDAWEHLGRQRHEQDRVATRHREASDGVGRRRA